MGRLDAAGDGEAARRVVTLVQGEYLPEDRYAEWTDAVRGEEEANLRRALRRLVQQTRGWGDLSEAIALADRLVELDPTDEGEQRELIGLLAQAGRRDRALAQYRRCLQILAEELGANAAPETLALGRAILEEGVHRPDLPVSEPG